MAQDYAKRKKAPGKRRSGAGKSAARRNAQDSPPRGRGLRLYLGGVLTGVFISFIAWLATLPAGVFKTRTPRPKQRLLPYPTTANGAPCCP